MSSKIKKFKSIAISGPIGSGKSTLARKLADKLGWPLESSGTFFRKWHSEHNVPLAQSSKIPEELDKKIDFGYQKQMKERKGVIFESHLAGWLAKDMPGVLKVLCIGEEGVRMERASRRDGLSVEEASKEAQERSTSHQEKFKRLYEIDDRFDPKYFDLVVDTSKLDPEETLEKVLEKLEE